MVESAEIGKNGHFTWIVYVCVDCGHRIFGAVINGLEGGFGVNTKCVMYTIRFSFRSMANGGAWFLVFLWPVLLLMWKFRADFLWCWCFEMYCFIFFITSKLLSTTSYTTEICQEKINESLNKCCWEYFGLY